MGTIVPPCAVVTTPSAGRVKDLLEVATSVRAGDVVGAVDGPNGRAELRAPAAGVIAGVLHSVTGMVAAGEGVLWMQRL